MTDFERITVPGLTDDEQALVNALLGQLAAKAQRNLLRSNYYDGKRALRQISPVVPPQYTNLAIVLGWSAKAVDTLARRCNLNDVTWDDGTLADIGYDEFNEANALTSELSGAVVSMLIHSTAFLVNTRGGSNEPVSLMHVKDALNATGTWNGRTRRLDNLLSVTDRNDDGEPTGLVLYLPGETISMAKDAGWTVEDRSPHPWGVPAEVIAYKPRPSRPFGSSRISRPVMSLHDAAVRTVVRMEGHADVYSYPELWLLGADESLFKNADGTQKAVWEVMLGRIKAIPDDEDAAQPRAEVHQFRASSPEPHLAQLKQQAQLFAGETSIPLTSLGVSDQSNPTSADSYVASREDLIAEAEGVLDDITHAVRRSVVRGLMIQNDLDAVPESWTSIAPKWRSPLYLSKAAEADAGSKQLATVPWLAETEVGLELLGLTPQQINSAMAEKRRLNGGAALRAIRERQAGGPPVVVPNAGDLPVPG